MRRQLLLLLLTLFSVSVFAQDRQVSGTVTDNDGGGPLAGVNVRVKGTALGTSTDGDGKFSVSVPQNATTLVFSFVGYSDQEVNIANTSSVSVVMSASAGELGEIVVSVGRGQQRTFTDTPLPVDNLTAKDLASTGQLTFDKALQYRVPSFNSINTPVNDATTLLDPYEIRNLGPSRTLILINGKRKNLSSLLYVQFAPGRGETGADLSAIPTDAIARVEILRDGASAQYGSDAIAGVMNVILKDKFEYSTLNINTGITGKGDGASYGFSFNSGQNIGSKGFLNYTLGFSQQDAAVRSGKIDVLTEVATFGSYTDENSASLPANANIVNFLAKHPTGGNINGTGATSAAKFLINMGLPIGATGQFYANAAFVSKRVLSYANYRTPYWKVDYGLLHTPKAGGVNYTGDNTLSSDGVTPLYNGYVGYVPTFEGNLTDYNATLGAKNEQNGWKHDASITLGGNQQLYSVNNTVNHTLGAAGPTAYKPGGYSFRHVVGNFDVSKSVTDKFFIGFGAEARNETYQIIAGDTASYSGEGSNSFPGIRAENARTHSRFNFGAYFDASVDVTDSWLIEGTIRGEKYSDFGNASVWKLSSRYKFGEKFVLRGSASTGFRAPTLHQIYAQSTQASFAGSTIVLSGLFNNISKEAFKLGIPKLKPETSKNYTIGAAFNPMKNLSITADYYDITISDRVLYSSTITTEDRKLAAPTTELGRILKGNSTGAGNFDLASVQFFINGLKTQTKGLDLVASYRGWEIGPGKLGVNLAGNFMLSNEIKGSPKDPQAIKDGGATILNAQIKSLLTEGRPRFKVIGGLDYSFGKFNVVLNNTIFGPTKFQDLDNDGDWFDSRMDANNIKQVFSTRVVTDLNVGYSFNKTVSASISVNNLFNVLPKWKLEALNTAGKEVLADPTLKQLMEGFLAFSGRYSILGYNGSQFSQLGTMLNAQISIKF
jgi:iron complex outermembrane recepter protein